MSPLPMKLLMTWEDIGTDHPEIPAKILLSRPPSSGRCFVRPLFLFPCPLRVCPLRARCVGVGVFFFFPFFFCVPRLASWLTSCHLIFIVISLSFPFHLPRCCGVCVCTIWRDVKLRCVAGDHRGPRGSVANEDTPWVPVTTYLLLISLGAYKSQLGGTNVYRCCFIWSTSTVIIRLYVYSYIYIFIMSSIKLLLFLHVGCTPQPNSQRQF